MSFEPVERSIGVDTELPETDAADAPAEWVAWGCRGFLRNTDASSRINARVAFRRLGDGEVYEEVLRTVPVSISACLSVMFPTIYGTALDGLGDDTKFGAAGLVMAIVGGALMPMVQGATLDAAGAPLSFIVPGLCFLVVAAYSAYDLRVAPASESR